MVDLGLKNITSTNKYDAELNKNINRSKVQKSKKIMAQHFFEKYPEYKVVEKPTEELVGKYKTLLPPSFIVFWKEYGFGSFMDGYLKIVNPENYQEILNEGFNNSNNEIVFAVTGLGDFLLWGENRIRFVNFRYGTDQIIGAKDDINWFLDRNISDSYTIEEEAKGTNYFLAREKYGEPNFDECFGYVPLLGIGGLEKVENLQKVKIREHILLIAEMCGIIE